MFHIHVHTNLIFLIVSECDFNAHAPELKNSFYSKIISLTIVTDDEILLLLKKICLTC